jgi:hypothetical protein
VLRSLPSFSNHEAEFLMFNKRSSLFDGEAIQNEIPDDSSTDFIQSQISGRKKFSYPTQ